MAQSYHSQLVIDQSIAQSINNGRMDIIGIGKIDKSIHISKVLQRVHLHLPELGLHMFSGPRNLESIFFSFSSQRKMHRHLLC